MPERLPSLNGLRVFEAAARHLSYSRAAEELFLTQSAVSHQIKALEDELKTKLFRRAGRAMLLTDEGQQFYAHVRDGLARFAKGVAELRTDTRPQTLHISSTPSLAAAWLVPRLSDFYHRYPEIDVSLRATTALADFGREDVDFGLRYGRGNWPGLRAEKLFQPDIFPVCSPRYRNGKLPQTPQQLLECVLLHVSELSWEEWFKSVDVVPQAPLRGPRFHDDALAIQAAENAQGVVLAEEALVSESLKARRLVRLMRRQHTLHARFAYYLVYPEGIELPRKSQVFRDWLLEQVKEPTA